MYGCACQAFKKIGIFLNDPARRGVRVAEEARLESVLGKELHNPRSLYLYSHYMRYNYGNELI